MFKCTEIKLSKITFQDLLCDNCEHPDTSCNSNSSEPDRSITHITLLGEVCKLDYITLNENQLTFTRVLPHRNATNNRESYYSLKSYT